MRYKVILNYVGQLRIYSFLDLLVLATALTRDLYVISGIGFLWLSFLLYLESRHNDKPRLLVNEYLWSIPFILALFMLPPWVCLSFAIFSYLYTNKKSGKFFGATSPFWRASQNGVLALGLNPSIAGLVFVLIFVRNLIGDFRDAKSDKQRGIETLPVLIGVQRNQVWAFYAHMLFVIATTIIWFHFSFLDIRLLLPIILLQFISYPLTPRLSNPKYLDIYNN